MRALAILAAALMAALAPGADACASEKLYDMRVFLGLSGPETAPTAARPAPAAPPMTAPAPPYPAPLARYAAAAPPPESAFRPSDLISELVAGFWSHDPGQDNNESNTWDVNAELIFTKLRLFDIENPIARFLLEPRPLIGGSVNNRGKTHTFYWAANWRYLFKSQAFVAFSFGFAYHTGNLKRATRQCPPTEICHLPGNRAYDDERMEVTLGSRVLFRESLALGYRIAGRHAVSLYAAHMSNAGVLADDNDGMNFVGIRYGYSLQ